MTLREAPLIGAALNTADLVAHREWLLDGQRDVEIQDPIFPYILDGDWRAVAHEARALLAGHTGRLGIHGPFLDLSLAPFDPLARELALRRLGQGMAFAEELGATHMVVHSPFLSFGHPAHTFQPASERAYEIEAAHAVLEPLLPRAEAIGCAIVVENIADGSPAPLLDLVRSFGTPLVRASLDTGHAAIMQGAGAPAPDQWVREAGELLCHVHLQDTDGLLDRHWAPGDGAISWHAVFEALGRLEQKPRLLLELNRPADVPRGAAYLVARGLAR
jgi:sugar phosphate isomerase/epimerase